MFDDDPSWLRLLKLEILTTLATESNITTILRELQEYVKFEDKEVVTLTIQVPFPPPSLSLIPCSHSPARSQCYDRVHGRSNPLRLSLT